MTANINNEESIQVRNREEATIIIKEKMFPFMVEGDYLVWYKSESRLDHPDIAAVYNKYHEETDFFARIVCREQKVMGRKQMKIKIPIIGSKDGQPVIDDFFENICNVANLNTGTIIGCPSDNIEDRARPFICIKNKVAIQKKYDSVPQEILNIYPDRPNKVLVHFFEVDIDESKLDLLTDEELKLIS